LADFWNTKIQRQIGLSYTAWGSSLDDSSGWIDQSTA